MRGRSKPVCKAAEPAAEPVPSVNNTGVKALRAKGFRRFIRMLLLLFFLLLLVMVATDRIRFLCVLSGSMEPAVPAGGLICIRSCRVSSLKPGDVITYVMGDGVTKVTHRIREKKEEDLFITKGDANKGADAAPVSGDRILGRLWFCLPSLGWMALHPCLAVMLLACLLLAIRLLFFHHDMEDGR